MKVIVVSSFGGPETLVVSDVAVPIPGAGEVLVTVESAGVGLVDVLQRMGIYPGLVEAGFVAGIEVAGTVGGVGSDVDAAWVGKRVFAQLHGGGYAEAVAAPVNQLVLLPDAVSSAAAVALGVNALVAEVVFEQAELAAGERVLVRGAGGGIGVMAVQLAAERGASVAAVTSSAERGERLKLLGADAIIDRTEDASPSGEGFDLIVDPVAGPETAAFIGQLRPGGRHVIVGFAGGLPEADVAMALVTNFQKSISLSTLSIDTADPQHLLELTKAMFERVASGSLQPVIDEELPLERAADAHRKIESGVFGKIVLVNPGHSRAA